MPYSSGCTSPRSNLEWLARSIGFVDLVCCGSYAKEQLYQENVEIRDTSSYESDDAARSVWREDDAASIVSVSKTRKSNQQRHKGHITLMPSTCSTKFPHSPSRSLDTATTVTTSTCTTIPTSVKKAPIEMETWEQHSPPRQPHEISFPIMDRTRSRRDTESSLSSLRFYAVTEGYEG